MCSGLWWADVVFLGASPTQHKLNRFSSTFEQEHDRVSHNCLILPIKLVLYVEGMKGEDYMGIFDSFIQPVAVCTVNSTSRYILAVRY
jgi:hypothetical protein